MVPRYLCISNCVALTDQALISLASHCRDLVTLECAGLHHLTDAGFQVMENIFKYIQYSWYG